MTRTVKIPDATHPITIRPTGSRVTVRVGGAVVAQTDSALSLAEASYPVVQYIPVSDVDQALLERTTSQTYCPYKGDASYYTVQAPDGSTEKDVVLDLRPPVPVGRRDRRARGVLPGPRGNHHRRRLARPAGSSGQVQLPGDAEPVVDPAELGAEAVIPQW